MKPKKEVFQLPEGHKKLVTRRDFLSHGLIAASSYLVTPTLLGTLFASERAQGCASLTRPTMLPLLVIDCSGGASLSGNFLGSGEGGVPLPEYGRMGIVGTPQTSNAHGLPIITGHGGEGIAGIYTALNEPTILSASGRNRLQVGMFVNQSQNDTGSNELNPAILAAQAGLQGEFFQNPLGTRLSASGGRSRSPISVQALRPYAFTRASDAVNSLSLGSTLNNRMTSAQRSNLARSLTRLSRAQMASFVRLELKDQFKALADCSLVRGEGTTDPNPLVEPTNFTDATEVFRIADADPDILAESKNRKSVRHLHAAIVHNVLEGYSGPGIIEIRGCDYHNNALVTDPNHGDNKDYEIGELLGRAVELANRRGRPLVVVIISDGSVAVNDTAYGSRRWTSDASGTASALMAYFDPTAAGISPLGNSQMLRTQIGHYAFTPRTGNPGKVGVSRDTYIGASPSRTAYAMFLNYLALNSANPAPLFQQWVDESTFASGEIDNHLLFSPRNQQV